MLRRELPPHLLIVGPGTEDAPKRIAYRKLRLSQDPQGAVRLSLMKQGAFIVNTARGGIIEEPAVTNHVELPSGLAPSFGKLLCPSCLGLEHPARVFPRQGADLTERIKFVLR